MIPTDLATAHYAISAIVLLLVLASAGVGSYVRLKLPDRYFDEASLGAMRLAVGLVATLAALVLSLLISSGKSSLDLVDMAIERNTVAMIRLDRTLAQFGTATDDLRVQVKQDYAHWIAFLFSSTMGKTAESEAREMIGSTYAIQDRLFSIKPESAMQEKLQDRAIELWDGIFAGRWLELQHRMGLIPMPLIAILVGWLVVIFGIFGFSAPRSWSMCVVFLLCSISATTAIYVVLDMDTPFQGMVNAAKAPMTEAFQFIGK